MKKARKNFYGPQFSKIFSDSKGEGREVTKKPSKIFLGFCNAREEG